MVALLWWVSIPDRQRAAPAMHIRNLYALRIKNGFPPFSTLLQQQGGNVHQLWPPIRNEALLAVWWHCKDLTRNQENVLQESSSPVQMPKACPRNSTSSRTWLLHEDRCLRPHKNESYVESERASARKTSESLEDWHSDTQACGARRYWMYCIVLDEAYVDTLEKLSTKCHRGLYWTIWMTWTVHIKQTAYQLACGNSHYITRCLWTPGNKNRLL